MGYNQNYQHNQNQGNQMPLGSVMNTSQGVQILTKQGWKPYVKKSGAKGGKSKKDTYYVSAWNASKKKGLITFTAFENKKSIWYNRDDGTKAVSMLFEVFYKNTGNKVLEIGFYNVNTGKVVLPKTGFIISTKSPNGGYCGILRKK